MKIFKEGNLNLNEIKNSILNRQSKFYFFNILELDWIKNYNTRRLERLTTHLRRNPKEQEKIATLAALNDQYLIVNEKDEKITMSQQEFDHYSQKLIQIQQNDLFDYDDDCYEKPFMIG